MATGLPVTIIRPQMSTREAIVYLATSFIGLLIKAWVVTLVLGVLDLPFTLTYWQALWVVVGLAVLFPADNTYRLWTKAGTR